MAKPVFLPRETFEVLLKHAVMPTFDLVLEQGNGIVLVRRKIPPYKGVWALPGLRMFKGERIEDTLRRIGKTEVGINIAPSQGRILGQYTQTFKTEHQRQDISTGYLFTIPDNQEIRINPEHFSSYRVTDKIPSNIGAMYKHYVKLWQNLRN